MRKIFVGVGVALAFAASAVSPNTATAQERFNWSGIYAGGNIGASFDHVHWAYYNLPGQTLDQNPTTFVAGIQAGAQMQFNRWVLGAEFGWSGSRDGGHGPDAPIFAPAYDATTRINSVMTIGPRVGYAVTDTLLVFATGGYAKASIDSAFFLRATPNDATKSTTSNNGWFIGGGVEYAVSRNWIVGIEYRHLQFDTEMAGPTNPPATGASRYIKADSDQVRARISFKIGP